MSTSHERAAAKAFADRVRNIAEEHSTSVARMAHAAWDQQVEGTSPDTLKKAMYGDDPRRPPMALMRGLAGSVGKDARELFPEYRLAEARRLFDEREVGLDVALENLALVEPYISDPAIAAADNALEAIASSEARAQAAATRRSSTAAGQPGRAKPPAAGGSRRRGAA